MLLDDSGMHLISTQTYCLNRGDDDADDDDDDDVENSMELMRDVKEDKILPSKTDFLDGKNLL